MRRALGILSCALAMTVFAASSGAANRAFSVTHKTTKHRAPANLLIDAQEWSLWPSRGKVPAGKVYVELWNRGQDAHDAWIRRLNAADQMVGPVLGKLNVTLPGKISQATWHLTPGRYELYCSEPGHAALGMESRLTVTRT
jgi:uncharacterized cupredoxin-like copper-binding protein